MSESSGLRERKKAETRSALGGAALSLSLEKGVEAVTADDIAAAANVSPRTFRNYFAGKEEALVAGFRAILDGYVDELAARPVDEPILTSLELVLAPIAAAAAARREETQAHLDLLSSPGLTRHRGLLIEEAVRAFIDEVAIRTGTDPNIDVYPRLVTTAAISAVAVAYDLVPSEPGWRRRGGSPPRRGMLRAAPRRALPTRGRPRLIDLPRGRFVGATTHPRSLPPSRHAAEPHRPRPTGSRKESNAVAHVLNRLGRAAFHRRRLVIALWAVVLTVMAVAGLSLMEPTATSFSLPGTESQRALDVLTADFPALGADGATARVVIGAPAGQKVTDPATTAAVEAVVKALGSVPQVASVLDPFQVGSVNLFKTMAYVQVGFAAPATQITGATRDALMAVAADGRAAGLTVEVGGDALLVPTSVGGQEGIGVLLAALILALTLGSLVAAGLPLLTALVGIGIGISGIAIATHVTTLSSFTPVLALMLGLAVAIDYSLFIVSRYRHELATGREPGDAAGRSVATAGSAVVFAGSTVVIALVALAVVNIPLITEMGLAAAITVAISVLAALTLLPAVLGFLGRRLASDRRPRR